MIEIVIYITAGIMLLYALVVTTTPRTGSTERIEGIEGMVAWIVAMNLVILWHVAG